MARDKRWAAKCNEVMDFMEKNQRHPSKHYPEEKLKHHWVHHNRKLFDLGQQKEEKKNYWRNYLH